MLQPDKYFYPHGQILPLYNTPTKDLFSLTLLTGTVHLVATFSSELKDSWQGLAVLY